MGLKKKRAQMIGVVSTLAVASLVSVGFAAWTILAPISNNAGVSITADGEVNSIYKAVSGFDSAQGGTIVYGGPTAKTQTDYLWLDWSGNDNLKEKLTESFVFVFKGPDIQKDAMLAKVSVSWADGCEDAWNNTDACKKYGIVGSLPAVNSISKSFADPVDNGDDDSGTYPKRWTLTVTVTFTWGKYGGSSTAENPYFHYNSTAYGADKASAAKTAIESLDDLESLATPPTLVVTINA